MMVQAPRQDCGRFEFALALAAVLLLSACAAPPEGALLAAPGTLTDSSGVALAIGPVAGDQGATAGNQSALAQQADQEPTTPPPDFIDEQEWIRFNSGEWLKGEFIALAQDSVEFDSAELEGLTLDWGDIAELITTRSFTVLLTDRSVLGGSVRVVDGVVFVTTEEGVVSFPREQIMRMIQGTPDGVNWSGKLRLSGTWRSGNTNQTDAAFNVSATRRTANSRTSLYLDAVVSEVDGSQIANNQTLRGKHDLYLSPRWYLTPLGLEFFRDEFQNIDLRATPYVGGGYTVIDRPGQEWNLNGGLGYQYTRFISVTPPEDDTRKAGTLILGTDYDQDLTDSVELELHYMVQLGLADTENTNQEAWIIVSFDFVWDLDFDVRFQWNRVGQPVADSGGNIPDRDDFRTDVGLSWEF